MESRARPLTEARIRELIDGMPAFNDRIRKRGRTKAGRTPLPLPAAEDFPAVGSLADAIAPTFSDDPAQVAFYQDVVRLHELLVYVRSRRGSPRDQINATIAQLRQMTVQIVDKDGGVTEVAPAMLGGIYEKMVSARIAQLETITDEELRLVERYASEIELAMMRSLPRGTGARRRRPMNKPDES